MGSLDTSLLIFVTSKQLLNNILLSFNSRQYHSILEKQLEKPNLISNHIRRF